jgi:PAS domain S-box-containing protein
LQMHLHQSIWASWIIYDKLPFPSETRRKQPFLEDGRVIGPVKPEPSSRRHLQQIVAGLSEGVILVNAHQMITWANDAALAMHGVADLAALGTTVDQYRGRFQLKYRNNRRLTKGQYPIERVVSGEAFHDVVVEVTPLGAELPQWVHRVRSLVLTDDAGEPDYLVLVLHDDTERFAAEERFEASFNVNPAPALICRLADQVFIKVNRGFLDLTGFGRDEIVARGLTEIDVLAGVENKEHVLACITHSKPMPQSESHLPLANGGVKPVIVAGQPIDVDDERCMLFTFMDLEPRQSAEDALRITREELQADFEALYTETPVPLHSVGPDMRLISVSNRWLELLGYDREEVIGHKIPEFMTQNSAAHLLEAGWQKMLDAGFLRDEEYQFVTKSGEVLDVLVSVRTSTDTAGALVRTMAALTDVTERKRSEERFSKAFALAPIPMMVSTLEHFRILDANEAFLAMVGHPRQAVIGRAADDLKLWGARTVSQRVEHDLRTAGRLRNLDVRITSASASGEVLDCVLSAETLSIHGQQCALLALQDITERRRSETQLFEAIETVMEDTSWFSRTVIEKLANLRQPAGVEGALAGMGDLSRREREVLGLLSNGMTDAEIGARLSLAPSTVRNHIAALYSKIGVHSRSNAIVWARERGITDVLPPKPATANTKR